MLHCDVDVRQLHFIVVIEVVVLFSVKTMYPILSHSDVVDMP